MDYFDHLSKLKKDIFVLQIGAHDGIRSDYVFPMVSKYNWKGLFVEPRPDLFLELQSNYSKQTDLLFANVAIDEKKCQRNLYYVPDSIIKKYSLSKWFRGIASFNKDHINILNHISAASVDDKEKIMELTTIIKENIATFNVECVPLKSLLSDHAIKTIDILVIDVEGVDYMVFKQFNFDLYKPYVICIEVKHMTESDQKQILNRLHSLGYNCNIHNQKDLLAIKPIP